MDDISHSLELCSCVGSFSMFLHLSVSHTEMYMCGMSLYSEDRGEKKRKQALTWWVWQVRVQIQYTVVLCSHCREVDLLWFVQMQKRFSVTNLDLFTNVVFQLAQLFFLCCGHFLYFQNKTRNIISCQVKKYDLYSAAINSATVYMYVCVQKGQHHSGP